MAQPPNARKRRLNPLWLVTSAVLVLLGLLTLDLNLNNKAYQERLATKLHEHFGIRLTFDNLDLHPVIGELSGQNLLAISERNGAHFRLKDFKIVFNPILLALGQVRIYDLSASEINIQTVPKVKDPSEDNKGDALPTFIASLGLKNAHFDSLNWSMGNDKNLSLGEVSLSSRFGTLFFKNPLVLKAKNVAFRSPKNDFFIDELDQEGTLLLDAAGEQLFDDSRFSVSAKASRILYVRHRDPKPWVTDPAFDEALIPRLRTHYPDGLPLDAAILFMPEVSLALEKTRSRILIDNLSLFVDDGHLRGSASWEKNSGELSIDLATLPDLPLSKMPFGRSRFRLAFDHIGLDFSARGYFHSLTDNNVTATALGRLTNNAIAPETGDVIVNLAAKVKNGQLTTNQLSVKFGTGEIDGKFGANFTDQKISGSLKLKDCDVKTIVGLFSSVRIPSIASGTAQIEGLFLKPKLTLDFTTPNATYEFLSFGGAKGQLVLNGQNLTLTTTSQGGFGSSHLAMAVTDLYDGRKQIMDLKSEFENVPLKPLLSAKRLDGSINGTFNMKRRDTVFTATGDFKANGFSIFDTAIGNLSTTLALNDKHLALRPIRISPMGGVSTQTLKGLDFDFTPSGYMFKGEIAPYLALSGTFYKYFPDFIDLQITANQAPLPLVAAFAGFKPDGGLLSGHFAMRYRISDPALSLASGQVSQFVMNLPAGAIQLTSLATIDYVGNHYGIHKATFKAGAGLVSLDGRLSQIGDSDLTVKGALDFNAISEINPYIADSTRPVSVDLQMKGSMASPELFGSATFHGETIAFRRGLGELDELIGTLRFNGHRVLTDNLLFNYNDAGVRLSGWAELPGFVLDAADVKFKASELPMRLPQELSLTTDLDLRLTGTGGSFKVAGKADIVDGRYARNFGLSELFLRPEETDNGMGREKLSFLPKDRTTLNIDIRNTGDFWVKNNLAELEMTTDLQLLGTLENPTLNGQIDFSNGKVNAFGVDFDEATGIAQFRANMGLNPKVEITARKEIQEYEILAKINGYADNLKLRLEASPSLDQREILSVLFYGQTPDQLTDQQRQQFSQIAAISQLAQVLSKPIGSTGLDVVKVSSRRETVNETVQRLSIGKRLSNRFSLAFTTDLGVSDPEKAIEVEYQIWDNFYLIFAKDFGERYRFDVSYRFELN